MRHIRANTDLGKLTEIALQWWQVRAGVSYPLLQQPHTPIEYTGNTWFTTLRTFLHDLNGSLRIHSINTTLPKPLRRNDRIIMDEVEKQKMTKKEKIQFNNVRIWMKVTRLSEISTADGQHLLRHS